MALFFECMPQCAQKVFDTADIVREGCYASHERSAVLQHCPGGRAATVLITPQMRVYGDQS